MSTSTEQLNCRVSSSAFTPLYESLNHQLSGPAAEWLTQTLNQVASAQQVKTLVTAFSKASRQVGKADLQIDRPGSDGRHFRHWSTDQAARTLLLLAFSSEDAFRQQQAVQMLFDNADVSEQVALYQSLPLLPHPESYRAQAIEGVRSAMTAVFNAIALRNPYPADHFDEAAWNQMVLKALFENSELSLIEGLDWRANPKLARMLCAYAHERWAANRPVHPQLWRPVGPFAEGDILADLEHALSQPNTVQQTAAALACAQTPSGLNRLRQWPELYRQIEGGQLTWDNLSVEHLSPTVAFKAVDLRSSSSER